MKIYIAALAGLMFVGCNQQAAVDLAVCKSDLAREQKDLASARAAQTAAEQSATELKAQLQASQEQLASLQKIVDDAAAAAEAQAQAEAEAAAAKEAAKKTAVAKQSAARKAEVKQAVQQSDVKVTQPVRNLTIQQKAKAAGF